MPIYGELYTPPVKSDYAYSGRTKRAFGTFICALCGIDFIRRLDSARGLSGLCKPCTNISTGKKNTVHGCNTQNSRLFTTWMNMKRRCLRPVNKEVIIYRGITLCTEWLEFTVFRDWSLKNGYSDALTIDRIDPNKGYEPNNCRYVDLSVQSANRRITDKNTTGHVGVYLENGKWRAKLIWRYRQINLGRFDTKEEAAKARNAYIDKHSLPHTRA